jgi:hypothetical protein
VREREKNQVRKKRKEKRRRKYNSNRFFFLLKRILIDFFFFDKNSNRFLSRVVLTCALRAHIKNLKMKLNNKFCLEKIRFQISRILNAQFPTKYFYL